MTKKERQTMSESRGAPRGEAFETREESLLSPWRAFVVQFRTETEGGQGHFAGRVEHIVSGRAARFHSPEELWAFFTQILSNIHDEKEVIP
jgi:hypothetical protein